MSARDDIYDDKEIPEGILSTTAPYIRHDGVQIFLFTLCVVGGKSVHQL